MPPTDVRWQLEPHTAAKHAILRYYLGGWYPKLASLRGKVVYLDGFAGPGRYKGGDEGSPLIALRTLLEHGHLNRMPNCEFFFLFNEAHPRRVASLKVCEEEYRRSIGAYPGNIHVQIANQSFDELVDEILAILETTNGSLAPTFAFIDPFGYRDISMVKISRLLRFSSCELFIYFDFNSVNRFATAGNVDHRLTDLFGTDEYRYAPANGPARAEFLKGLYERQLRDVGGFPFVQSFRMANRQGRTINYLSFATRNLEGLKLMKRAMWSADPSGEFEFSDLTSPTWLSDLEGAQ